MAIEFLNAGNIQPEYTSWFFYGGTRSGKTTAASTFPRPLFIQPKLEDSQITLQGMAHVDYIFTWGIERTNEILIELEARSAKAQALWAKNTDEAIAEGDALFPWQTIVVESLTHYCDHLVEELTRGSMLDMDQQKWGKLSSHLRNIHARLRSLPVHIVYVALDKRIHNKKGDLVGADFAFPGQQSERLPSACGSVVHFERIPGNPRDIFRAHLAKHSVFAAGTRYKVLRGIKKLEPFDWSGIATKLGW